MKVFAIVLVGWSLVASPLLCRGGLLAQAHHHHDEDTSECEHQPSCPGDPCAAAILAQPNGVGARPRISATTDSPALVESVKILQNLVLAARERPPDLPPRGPTVPYAPSDLPLLV